VLRFHGLPGPRGRLGAPPHTAHPWARTGSEWPPTTIQCLWRQMFLRGEVDGKTCGAMQKSLVGLVWPVRTLGSGSLYSKHWSGVLTACFIAG
jgi:hypothetical protein